MITFGYHDDAVLVPLDQGPPRAQRRGDDRAEERGAENEREDLRRGDHRLVSCVELQKQLTESMSVGAPGDETRTTNVHIAASIIAPSSTRRDRASEAPPRRGQPHARLSHFRHPESDARSTQKRAIREAASEVGVRSRARAVPIRRSGPGRSSRVNAAEYCGCRLRRNVG